MEQDLKKQLVHSIFQFKRLVSTGFGVDTFENKGDINITELILMNAIAENSVDSENNVFMPDIRGYLSISKAAVSQMLRSLEKKGYIEREIDKSNRRNLIVTLTTEGHEVLEGKHEEFSNRLEKIICHLGEDDVRQMIAIVNRMIEIINKLNDEAKEELK